MNGKQWLLWAEWEFLIFVNTSSIWKPTANRTTGARTHTDTLNHWVYLPSSSGLVVAPDGWGCYRHLLWGVKCEKFITHVIEPCMIHIKTFCLGDDPLPLSQDIIFVMYRRIILLFSLTSSNHRPRTQGSRRCWSPSQLSLGEGVVTTWTSHSYRGFLSLVLYYHQGYFCVEFACSLCVIVGSLLVLQLLPKLQRHAVELKWELWGQFHCENKIVYRSSLNVFLWGPVINWQLVESVTATLPNCSCHWLQHQHQPWVQERQV